MPPVYLHWLIWLLLIHTLRVGTQNFIIISGDLILLSGPPKQIIIHSHLPMNNGNHQNQLHLFKTILLRIAHWVTQALRCWREYWVIILHSRCRLSQQYLPAVQETLPVSARRPTKMRIQE